MPPTPAALLHSICAQNKQKPLETFAVKRPNQIMRECLIIANSHTLNLYNFLTVHSQTILKTVFNAILSKVDSNTLRRQQYCSDYKDIHFESLIRIIQKTRNSVTFLF